MRLAVPAIVGLAAVAWWDWLALLLSAPWLVAVLWVVLRRGMLDEIEAVPSSADEARRRLWAR